MSPRKRPVRAVAIYARRSKKNLVNDVEVQLARCRARARSEGWSVVGEYVDNGVSAWSATTKKPREGYERMLADVEAGRVDSVLAYKDDRLFRRDRERLRFQDVMDAAGVWRVSYADGSSDDLTTADGRKRFRERGSGAEHFSDILSERMRDHHAYLAREGLPNGGAKAFGYDYDRATKQVTVNEREAQAVRDAARRILGGEALRSVTRRWNAAGFRTGFGKEWHAKAVKRVLSSQRIVGKREASVGGGPKEVVGKAAWPAIIDPATHRRLLAEFSLREDAAAERGLPTNKRYLLTGLVVCSSCGDGLVGHPQRGARSYTCLSKKDHAKGARPRIQAAPLEALVVEQAYERRAAQPPAVFDPRDASEVEQQIILGQEAAQERLTELLEMLGAGELSREEYGIAARPLRAQIDELDAELARLQGPPAAENRYRWLREWLDRGAPEFADDPEVRADLEAKVDRVVVSPAGRSKWVPLADRVEVVWREGVAEAPDSGEEEAAHREAVEALRADPA